MRRFFFAAALAAGMAVGVAAQSATDTSSAQKTSKHAAKGTTVVSGCLAPLKQSDSAVGATTGTTGATANDTSRESRNSSGRFALLNPAMGPAPSPSNGDVTPTSDTKVILEGTNLKKYEGHHVELRGRWFDDKSTTAEGHADQHNVKFFRVASVTTVDGNCSTTGR